MPGDAVSDVCILEDGKKRGAQRAPPQASAAGKSQRTQSLPHAAAWSLPRFFLSSRRGQEALATTSLCQRNPALWQAAGLKWALDLVQRQPQPRAPAGCRRASVAAAAPPSAFCLRAMAASVNEGKRSAPSLADLAGSGASAAAAGRGNDAAAAAANTSKGPSLAALAASSGSAATAAAPPPASLASLAATSQSGPAHANLASLASLAGASRAAPAPSLASLAQGANAGSGTGPGVASSSASASRAAPAPSLASLAQGANAGSSTGPSVASSGVASSGAAASGAAASGAASSLAALAAKRKDEPCARAGNGSLASLLSQPQSAFDLASLASALHTPSDLAAPAQAQAEAAEARAAAKDGRPGMEPAQTFLTSPGPFARVMCRAQSLLWATPATSAMPAPRASPVGPGERQAAQVLSAAWELRLPAPLPSEAQAQWFAFDTPSPDDVILQAQHRAGVAGRR